MMKKYSALTKYINLLKNDNAGEWICDKENDGSSKDRCTFLSSVIL